MRFIRCENLEPKEVLINFDRVQWIRPETHADGTKVTIVQMDTGDTFWLTKPSYVMLKHHITPK